MSHPLVIIGTGLAGYQLAKEIRKRDTELPMLLITSDSGDYYSKPELSTALAKGKDVRSLVTAEASAMAGQLKADILTHSLALSVDAVHRTIQLNDKKISYDKLVLACGADTICPALKGDAVDSVLSVNHLHHYATFHESIQDKKIVAILGAGLIGCEFANDLSASGYEVHVVALAKTPLDLLLPPAIGHLLQAALEKQGVQLHFECAVEAVNKDHAGYRLSLSNGDSLFVDAVLSAIGLKPHLHLAKSAGLAINKGIIVNPYLETSDPCIYALGDCAEVEGRVLPYVAPILHAARALASTLTGERVAVDYPPMPIVVKTPAFPLIVCPPLPHAKGEWVIESVGDNTRALFYDDQKQLKGFVLTGVLVKERMMWVQQLVV